MPIFQSGAAIDNRPESEKNKDVKLKEAVASAAPASWVEKTPDKWRKFPIFNQNGSGSCVAQTQAKELGIMRALKDGVYVHFSATDIYQRRANRPSIGMLATDARNIARAGVTLEVLTPSQNLTDSQMDGALVEPYKRQVGAVFSAPNYLEDPVKDIETTASVIQTTSKGTMLWFYFKADEWTEHPIIKYPTLDLSAPDTLRHSVTGVEACLVGGKKSVIIEDSWGTSYGLAGQRVIDLDFFLARNWYAGHLMNFKFDEQLIPKPHYVFNNDLEFGMTNAEVKILQDIFKYEGMFPTNFDSTGYFGAETKKSAQKFQTKYGISSPSSAGYGRVGPKTRARLNEIYGQ